MKKIAVVVAAVLVGLYLIGGVLAQPIAGDLISDETIVSADVGLFLLAQQAKLNNEIAQNNPKLLIAKEHLEAALTEMRMAREIINDNKKIVREGGFLDYPLWLSKLWENNGEIAKLLKSALDHADSVLENKGEP